MAYQLGIPDALRRFGVPVEVVPGWQTRGRSSLNPGGVTCHWTAGPRGTTGRPSLNVVVNGRPGLSGPLCNVYFDRNGVAVVVAAGTANHAGRGGWRGLVGNHRVLGIEAESAGDGQGSDWTPAQRANYPKVAAALQWLTGHHDAQMVHGHNEWTTAKIDIRDWPMPLMRQQVATLLSGGSISQEDDMPAYAYANATKPQPLVKNKWKGLIIDSAKGYLTIAHQHRTVQATAYVAVSGLPEGAEIQVEAIVCAGDTWGTVQGGHLGVHEVIGTRGRAFAQIPITAATGPNQRLRLRALAFDDGVTIDTVRVKVLEWQGVR